MIFRYRCWPGKFATSGISVLSGMVCRLQPAAFHYRLFQRMLPFFLILIAILLTALSFENRGVRNSFDVCKISVSKIWLPYISPARPLNPCTQPDVFTLLPLAVMWSSTPKYISNDLVPQVISFRYVQVETDLKNSPAKVFLVGWVKDHCALYFQPFSIESGYCNYF